MQSIWFNVILLALLASPALGSAGIKGASYASKGGSKNAAEYSSPAAKGRLVVSQQAVPAPVVLAAPVKEAPASIGQSVVRSAPAIVSVESREWLSKQEQILQQQHESLDQIQRDLKQTQEQQRIEQNRQVDDQNLLEPAVRPARLNQSAATKTSQQTIKSDQDSYSTPIKGGQQQQIKQEREEQKLEPLIEQQKEEQQQEEVTNQRQDGAEAEPYSFEYNTEGQSRGESGDKNGVVRGYYRLASGDGQDRLVEYIADSQGFRAVVKTNEFGTEARSPANVALHSSQPLAEEIARAYSPVEQKQRLSPSLSAVISQSPVQVPHHEHAPIPLPVQPKPIVHLAAPPSQQAPVVPVPIQTSSVVREESGKAVERSERVEYSPQQQQQQQQHELDDQVQLIKANTVERGGKSLEVVRQSPSVADRSFSSATAHRPVVQASPVSHRVSKAEPAPLRAPVQSPLYNSGDDSHLAGFEHPLDS